MERKNYAIGLFGFGCVGQGLYDVLNYSQGLEANIAKICVKDQTKERKIDMSNFTFDREDILSRKDLDVIVELIDNSEDALEIVSRAMNNGLSVVSANKKLLAEHFDELYQLHVTNGVSLIYEGACAGSIPIIRNLEEYYDNELLSSIRGILNGSCNYILTKMEVDNQSYQDALKEAQENGFAEIDPWLDVAGYDTKYKLLLLNIHGFGIVMQPEQILNLGIQNVSIHDINYAREKNLRIKLLGKSYKVGDQLRTYALPHFIPRGSALSNINYEYNGVEVEGAFSDKQVFAGKGAGSYPTASAVLSDISALTYDYKYGYKKLKKRLQNGNNDLSKIIDKDFSLKLYIRFDEESQLDQLDVLSIEEEYTSKNYNYVIANVAFSSLFNLADKKENKLFISVAVDS